MNPGPLAGQSSASRFVVYVDGDARWLLCKDIKEPVKRGDEMRSKASNLLIDDIEVLRSLYDLRKLGRG
ncbi:hypothetical protein NDU88_003491 [Pleurodeles waltl]|uniref:Uncharacterized protein n=1 Tax=Pleurodeles waltl TaxID=8319 RepID=A0AAV7VH92_PLEWA|nr:hypothetical protein NDU88_003491 [Pleurodeles waltl]